MTRVVGNHVLDTKSRVTEVLDNIEYKPGFSLYLLGGLMDGFGGFTVRVAFTRADTYTGAMGIHYQAHSFGEGTTRDQLVQALFGIVQAIEIHECREAFKYQGWRIYGPHMDLDALMIAAVHSEDTRVNGA